MYDFKTIATNKKINQLVNSGNSIDFKFFKLKVSFIKWNSQ